LKLFSRHMVALVLLVIYSLITVSPLAPLTLKSPKAAHAVSGECSGNCNICGCSAERRANHTCCCWQKKLRHQNGNEKVADCCKKKMRHRMAMISCNCPCGGNKQPFLPGSENSEYLSCRFDGVVVMDNDTLSFASSYRMSDRDIDPPDPPPKLHLLS
jgi:hypothetical protein